MAFSGKPDRDDWTTPAFWRRSSIAEAKQSLSDGADPNACRRGDGLTSLHMAVIYGTEEMVAVLIAAGANIDGRCSKGETPLQTAARAGKRALPAMRALIAARANIGAVNNDGDAALHLAAKEGHVETVKALIEARADIGALNKYKQTPLHSAVGRRGEAGVVSLLLEKRADVHVVDVGGRTPLHFAVKWRHNTEPVVLLLIDAGANIKARDNTGASPLFVAADNSNVVEVPVAAGASIRECDDRGQTSLHRAAGWGDYGMAQTLLKAGANAFVCDKDGYTPEQLASKSVWGKPVARLIAGQTRANRQVTR